VCVRHTFCRVNSPTGQAHCVRTLMLLLDLGRRLSEFSGDVREVQFCINRFQLSCRVLTHAVLLHDSFCRAMLCIARLFAVTRCPSMRLSVCASVTFRGCAKTNKHIFEIFSPSGSDTILVFSHQRGCRYSDGNPPNGSVECKGYDEMPIFFTNISLYLRNGYT